MTSRSRAIEFVARLNDAPLAIKILATLAVFGGFQAGAMVLAGKSCSRGPEPCRAHPCARQPK